MCTFHVFVCVLFSLITEALSAPKLRQFSHESPWFFNSLSKARKMFSPLEFPSGVGTESISVTTLLSSWYLSTIGYNCSAPLSLLPSVESENGLSLKDSVISSVFSLAIAPTSFLALVRPHLNWLAISESGNILRKRSPAWSAMAIGRLCSTRKLTNRSSAFVVFWLIVIVWLVLNKDRTEGVAVLTLDLVTCLGVLMCLSRSYRAPLLILISTVQISQKAYSSPIFERWMNGHVREYSSRNFWVTFCFFAGGRDMMNTDRIKMCIIYVYNRSSPEIFKNPSTGLKLTKIRLDLVEKSRDQVKIEARMAHWVAT